MAFVYISDRQEALLFGGQGSSDYLHDTWTWKSGCWTELAPAHNPPGFVAIAAAYDPSRGVVVMYGGYWIAGSPRADTWLWNGIDWQQAATVTPVLAPVAAYDPNSKRVVVYGESTGGVSETWTWNGSAWEQMLPTKEPPGRQEASMTYDRMTNTLLLFGGIGGTSNDYLSDTWSWNGNDWTALSPATSPPARAQATMVGSAAGNGVLLTGGLQGGQLLSDTWTWDGRTWAKGMTLGPRVGAGAIDTGTETVVFGGASDTQRLNDLLRWDGSTWSPI
jgi:hypothetical protein